MIVQGSLFDVKTITEDYLASRFPQVAPQAFYRDLFPVGELEKRGEYERGKYCGIAVRLGDRPKRYSVTDDLEVIDELVATDDFCLMSPVSYAGKSQKQSMSRWLYSVTIDLDEPIERPNRFGDPTGIAEFFFEVGNNVLPMPTYIVSSGTGLHLYYMLKRPVALYRNVIEQLSRLRRDLIWKCWNRYITDLYEKPQYESVTQGFRMVGTVTKSGDRVRAYKTGEKVTIEHLNQYVLDEKNQVTEFRYKSPHTLQEAKELYPEWYQKRIVEGQPRNTWVVKRDLYDWWKRQAKSASYGHRYFFVMALAIYAIKCAITEEELTRDALELVPFLNDIDLGHPFTRQDALKACEMYNADYQTFPRAAIERLTGIRIDPNKRNYRHQNIHLKGARAIRDINCESNGTDWRYHGGAPTKEAIVRAWREANPNGRKIDCERETGISRPTVLKWWNA